MKAATVILAPLAYIKVGAVKKLIGLLYERPFTCKGNYLVFSFKEIYLWPKYPFV